MQHALDLRHPACVESALHGLGHLAKHDGTGRARDMIGRWLARKPAISPALREYAERCHEGYIQ